MCTITMKVIATFSLCMPVCCSCCHYMWVENKTGNVRDMLSYSQNQLKPTPGN